MIHPTDTQETYLKRENTMSNRLPRFKYKSIEQIKKELRELIKEWELGEDEVNSLAHEYICDTHQTGDFLIYLQQVLAGEI